MPIVESFNDAFAYVTDKQEREAYFDAAASPQDNLEHTIYIGIILYINAIAPIVMWTVW